MNFVSLELWFCVLGVVNSMFLEFGVVFVNLDSNYEF